MRDPKRWFSARVLMESVHSPPDAGPVLFEDKIILVRADSEEDARARAKTLAKASEHKYKSAEGNLVRWVYRSVLDVVTLFDEKLSEGSEVYYHLLSADEVEQLKRSLEPGSLG